MGFFILFLIETGLGRLELFKASSVGLRSADWTQPQIQGTHSLEERLQSRSHPTFRN